MADVILKRQAGPQLDRTLNPVKLARASGGASENTLGVHGTVSTGTEDISFTDNYHSLTTGGSHTWTFSDDTTQKPAISMELVVSGGTPTITTPADAKIYTSQKLSSLATGTYEVVVKRLTVDATYNYAIFVGLQP
jgi:hypothetical protein